MSATAIKLRKATDDDKQALFDFINDAYAIETGNTGVAFKRVTRFEKVAEVEKKIKDTSLMIAFFENEPDKMIGCGALERIAEGVVDLGPFCIDPKLKGRGIGSALLTILKKFARDEMQAHTLEITVINHRSDLFPMYEHHGFVYTGKTIGYTAENGFDESWITRPTHFVVMHFDLTKL